MTATAVEDEHTAPKQEDVADERLANLPGCVVMVAGRDGEGRDAIAIWTVAPSGRPTGAWVPTRASLASDSALARGLMRVVSGRAVLGRTFDDAAALLAELVGYAGADVADDSERVVTLPDALDDLRAARRSCEEALASAREKSRQKLVPLAWTHDVGSVPLSSNEDVRRLAGLARPAGAPAPAEALLIVAGLRWVTVAWLETEQMRRRRSALRDALPSFAPIPTRLADAMEKTA